MKTFLKSSIAIGITSAIGLLGSNPAYAQFMGCGTSSAGGLITSLPTSCIVGDKLYSNFSTNITGLVFVSISQNAGQQHSLTVASAGGLNASASPATFNYTITSIGPYDLLTWQTDTQGAIAPNNYVNTTAFTNDASGNSPVNLVYGNASISPQPFLANTTTSDVTHSITGYMTTTGFTDTVVQTPGPLAILGAGTAFGFSRRLRRRITTTGWALFTTENQPKVILGFFLAVLPSISPSNSADILVSAPNCSDWSQPANPHIYLPNFDWNTVGLAQKHGTSRESPRLIRKRKKVVNACSYFAFAANRLAAASFLRKASQ